MIRKCTTIHDKFIKTYTVVFLNVSNLIKMDLLLYQVLKKTIDINNIMSMFYYFFLKIKKKKCIFWLNK